MSSQTDQPSKSGKKPKENKAPAQNVASAGSVSKDELARRKQQSEKDKKIHQLASVVTSKNGWPQSSNPASGMRISPADLKMLVHQLKKMPTKSLFKDTYNTTPHIAKAAGAVLEARQHRKNHPKISRGLHGNGDYWDDIVGAGKGLLKGGAHSLINKLFGEGDYNMVNGQGIHPERTIKEHNTIIDGVPSVSADAYDLTRTVVQHCEMLGEVAATEDFTSTKYALNPGLPGTFPWLSPIANQYQQYRLKACIFEFRSMATGFAEQTSLGQLAFASNYNADATPFTDFITMLNS